MTTEKSFAWLDPLCMMAARGASPAILNYTVSAERNSGTGRGRRRSLAVTKPSHATVTGLLRELQVGNRAALGELFPLVYGELRVLAHPQRRRCCGDSTLNTTALIHEAYVKLVEPDSLRRPEPRPFPLDRRQGDAPHSATTPAIAGESSAAGGCSNVLSTRSTRCRQR